MKLTMSQVNRRDFLRMVGAGAAVVGVGGLAACGGEGSSDGEADQPSLTAWSLQLEGEEKAVQAIIADYEKQNDVKIATTSLPYEEYLRQLLIQMRGDNVVGAVQLNFDWLSTMAAQGTLVDLGSIASEEGYVESALEGGKFDGVQYGLPWTAASIGMIANSELLEQAGVSKMPKTIEEFEAALEALKGIEGITPYAAMTAIDQLKDITAWLWTFGSDIISDGKVTLGDEGSVSAVQWYKGLLDKGYIAPEIDRFDARALFSQGKVGFYDDAPLAKTELLAQSSDPDLESKITAMPRPVMGSGDPQALLWGRVVVVVDREGSDASAELARYLTSNKEAVLQYFKGTTLPPTTEEALQAPPVQSDEFIGTFVEQITPYALPSPFWAYPEYSRMDTILGEQVQAVLAGKTTAQEAMDTAAREINEIIN